MFKSTEGAICPLLRKPCIKEKCAWWCGIQGYDTNTGKQIDSHECVALTLPFLLIENSAQQRSTGAAVESMRNEMVTRANTTNAILGNFVFPAQVQSLPQTETYTAELPSSDQP